MARASMCDGMLGALGPRLLFMMGEQRSWVPFKRPVHCTEAPNRQHALPRFKFLLLSTAGHGARAKLGCGDFILASDSMKRNKS